MDFTAQQIAALIGGTIEGDSGATVNNLAKIEEGVPGTLTFLANPKYKEFIYTTQSSIAIVGNDFVAEKPVVPTLIKVQDPYQSFAKLLDYYNQIQHNHSGIDQLAYVSPTAKIGEGVYIGAFAYIGDHVVIGDHAKIYPQVYIGDHVVVDEKTVVFAGAKVYAQCKIGAHCTIHAGTVIGADGFGFAPNQENQYKKVPQIGNVVIEDHVEIGANTTIDRATLGSTIIRKGVKLDNLIQIAHNVEIGENTVVASQTGIAGSTKIGKNCMIGGQVGIVGHLTIADGVKIAAQSGVGANISTEGEILQGSPAFGLNDYRRAYVIFRKLPQLEKRIKELEQALAEVTKL